MLLFDTIESCFNSFSRIFLYTSENHVQRHRYSISVSVSGSGGIIWWFWSSLVDFEARSLDDFLFIYWEERYKENYFHGLKIFSLKYFFILGDYIVVVAGECGRDGLSAYLNCTLGLCYSSNSYIIFLFSSEFFQN